MELSTKTQEQIQQLQLIEQNLQAFTSQKQHYLSQIMECDSALSELESSPVSYKIIGNIMVEVKAEDLKKELIEKKETSEIRLKNIETQEDKLQAKAKELQEDIQAQVRGE